MTKSRILVERNQRRQEIRFNIMASALVLYVVAMLFTGYFLKSHQEVMAQDTRYYTESIKTNKGTFYPMLVTCTDIVDDTVICVDSQGNEWTFISNDAFINDVYSFVMDSKGTELDITDDEIVVIRFEKGDN